MHFYRLFYSVQGSLSVPLGIAAEKGHIDAVRVLIAAGAVVQKQNKVSI